MKLRSAPGVELRLRQITGSLRRYEIVQLFQHPPLVRETPPERFFEFQIFTNGAAKTGGERFVHVRPSCFWPAGSGKATSRSSSTFSLRYTHVLSMLTCPSKSPMFF